MKKLVGAAAVVLLGMLFVTSLLGGLHKPEPRGVPIAVVGPAQTVPQLGRDLDARAPGAFELLRYGDERAGRAALLGREVDGVLLVREGRLIVAGAAGRTASTVITQVFQGAAQARGLTLAVEDAVPLPPGDPGGISGMFYVLGLLVPGFAIAALVSRSAWGMTGRLNALVTGAIGVGFIEAWLADVVYGALPGHLLALTTVSAGIVLTIGLTVLGLLRVAGFPGGGLAALLFFPVGLPTSGGPLGPHFIPEWYATIGRFLPIGAGSDAVRNTVFFEGAALGVPLAVLSGWALLGSALLSIPARPPHKAATGTATRPLPVA